MEKGIQVVLPSTPCIHQPTDIRGLFSGGGAFGGGGGFIGPPDEGGEGFTTLNPFTGVDVPLCLGDPIGDGFFDGPGVLNRPRRLSISLKYVSSWYSGRVTTLPSEFIITILGSLSVLVGIRITFGRAEASREARDGSEGPSVASITSFFPECDKVSSTLSVDRRRSL